MNFKIGDVIRSKREVYHKYEITTFLTFCKVVDIVSDDDTGELKYMMDIIYSKDNPGLVGSQVELLSSDEADFVEVSEEDRAVIFEERILDRNYWINENVGISRHSKINSCLNYSTCDIYPSGDTIRRILFRITRMLDTDNTNLIIHKISSTIDFNWLNVYKDYNSEYFYLVPDLSIMERTVEALKEKGFEEFEYNFDLFKFVRFDYKLRVMVRRSEQTSSYQIIYLTSHNIQKIYAKSALIYYQIKGIQIPEDIRIALEELDRDKYLKCLEDIASEILTLREQKRVDNEINNLEKFVNHKIFSNIGRIINDLQSEINDLKNRLHSALKRHREQLMKQFYLENKKSTDNEFIEYIRSIKEKVIHIYEYDIGKYAFNIKTYMSFWDDKLFEEYYEYDSYLNDSDYAWVKKLFKDIFLDKNIKLVIEQKFIMDFDNCSVNKSTDYINDFENKTGIRNPHIHFYNCWGEYYSNVEETMSEGNYIDAFNYCLAACSGIAWNDSAVANQFRDYIYNWGYEEGAKCLELENGELISIYNYRIDYC